MRLKKTGSKRKDNRTKNLNLVLVLIIAALVLLTPQAIRIWKYDGHGIGDIQYYHLRMAEAIGSREDGQDLMIYGDRPYVFTPYHHFLSFLGTAIGLKQAMLLLPILAGTISAIAGYLLLGSMGYRSWRRNSICLLWFASPVFIHMFVLLGPMQIGIALVLAGACICHRKHHRLALPFFLAATLFLPYSGLVPIASVILLKKTMPKDAFWYSILAIVLASALVQSFLVTDLDPVIEEQNLLQDNLVELGSLHGFSFFMLLLAGVGLAGTWRKKRRYAKAYGVFAIFALIAVYLEPQYKAIAGIGIAFFAASGLFTLRRMSWEIRPIKYISLAVLILGVTVSFSTYIWTVSNSGPDNEIMGALHFLEQDSAVGQLVATHKDNGFWVQYFASRPVMLDSLTPADDPRNEDLDLFLKSRDLDDSQEIISNYSITYILVDQKTREAMIEDNVIGLKFLLENSERFESRYVNDKVSLWKYYPLKTPETV